MTGNIAITVFLLLIIWNSEAYIRARIVSNCKQRVLFGLSSNDEDSRALDVLRLMPLASIPSKEQRRVIEERQIGRPAVSLFGIENTKCKHGFPQAFVQYPVGGGVSSGMIRLTCPHLVKAVDEYEREGALEEFDGVLADDEAGKRLRENFLQTNFAWREIREKAVTVDERKLMDEKLGKAGAAHLMESGIIGCTPGKNQVKCLHAHIADNLVRGTNEIGQLALKRLEDRGVDVKGCADCWQQCDLNHTRTSDSWWYVPAKNKQKLRSARLRRIEDKMREFGVVNESASASSSPQQQKPPSVL